MLLMKIYSFLEQRIKSHIRLYLTGNITLDEFTEWFITETWDVEQQTNSKETKELIYEIDNALIQLSQEHISQDEFKDILSSFIEDRSEEYTSSSIIKELNRLALPYHQSQRPHAHTQSEVASLS